MPNRKTCAKCGSRDVIPEAPVPDKGDAGVAGDMEMRIPENPHAWIFKGMQSTPVRADICGACGYMELYVEDPRLLWKTYRSQNL